MTLAAIAALALVAASATTPPASAAPAALDAPHWRLLGPFRAGWATMVAGPPSEPDTLYFGGAGGGLWRTRNAGRTWAPLFDHGPASAIGALAIAPSDPNTLYIGTGQPTPRYDVAAGLGVYRSSDGGATWTSAGLQSTRYIGRILVDPRDANTVLIGAQGHFFGPSADRGVYRTTDGGRTWTQTLKLGLWTGVVDLASDPADARIVFAAAWEAHQYPWQSYFTPVSGPGSGLYRSNDGGLTWTRLSGGGWPTGVLGRISLSSVRREGGFRLYAEVDSPTAGGLYRSDDGGAHWVQANAEDAATSYYASRVTAAPDDPDTVYLVGQSIRRCTHGGATCEIVRGSPGGDDYHFVWINPLHPDHMAAGSDQGAIASVDGGRTWSDWYNQPTGQFYHLAADNRFPFRVYSGQQDSGTVGIASRSDYGAISLRDWTPVGGDERDYDIPDPTDPDIVYGSGLGGRVTKWDARTGQVQNVSPWPISSYGKRPTTVRYRYNWVTPLVASDVGTPTLYLGSQLVFRSTNRGRSWTAISGDLTGKREGATGCDGEVAIAAARACGYGTIVALQPSPRHEGELWVGTDDGLIQLTRDGGAHWADVTPPTVPDWAKVQAIDVSALQDGVAYAAVDGQRIDDFQPHALATRDYGHTWRDITANLPRDHIVSVVRADPKQAGLLYTGTDAGVFVSFDDGGSWAPLQANLPTAWVRDLLVHDNDLVAATQGRAIWIYDDLASLRQRAASPEPRTRLFTPSPAVRVRADENKDTPPPPETALGENPPPGAAIDYEIGGPAQGAVTLQIADAQGRVVRRWSSAATAPAPKVEVYFDKAWLRPPQALDAAPGVHRFVWDLHEERPPTIKSDYTIAAVWGRGVPSAPQGPLALPGDYTVTLTVDGRRYSAPLHLAQDPRVHVQLADLQASMALSQRIDAALAQARIGYGQMQAVETRIDALFPQAKATMSPRPTSAPATSAADRAGDLPDQARALASGLRQPPAPDQPGFDTVAGVLGAVESDLENADAAPTAAQVQVVDAELASLARAQARWDAFRTQDLVKLNAALQRAGRPPIVVPQAGALSVTPPDPGQDLP